MGRGIGRQCPIRPSNVLKCESCTICINHGHTSWAYEHGWFRRQGKEIHRITSERIAFRRNLPDVHERIVSCSSVRLRMITLVYLRTINTFDISKKPNTVTSVHLLDAWKNSRISHQRPEVPSYSKYIELHKLSKESVIHVMPGLVSWMKSFRWSQTVWSQKRHEFQSYGVNRAARRENADGPCRWPNNAVTLELRRYQSMMQMFSSTYDGY